MYGGIWGLSPELAAPPVEFNIENIRDLLFRDLQSPRLVVSVLFYSSGTQFECSRIRGPLRSMLLFMIVFGVGF